MVAKLLMQLHLPGDKSPLVSKLVFEVCVGGMPQLQKPKKVCAHSFYLLCLLLNKSIRAMWNFSYLMV